jgi:hypothetical protein
MANINGGYATYRTNFGDYAPFFQEFANDLKGKNKDQCDKVIDNLLGSNHPALRLVLFANRAVNGKDERGLPIFQERIQLTNLVKKIFERLHDKHLRKQLKDRQIDTLEKLERKFKIICLNHVKVGAAKPASKKPVAAPKKPVHIGAAIQTPHTHVMPMPVAHVKPKPTVHAPVVKYDVTCPGPVYRPQIPSAPSWVQVLPEQPATQPFSKLPALPKPAPTIINPLPQVPSNVPQVDIPDAPAVDAALVQAVANPIVVVRPAAPVSAQPVAQAALRQHTPEANSFEDQLKTELEKMGNPVDAEIIEDNDDEEAVAAELNAAELATPVRTKYFVPKHDPQAAERAQKPAAAGAALENLLHNAKQNNGDQIQSIANKDNNDEAFE